MIPKVIYQTWKTKNIPYISKKNIKKMKKLNPDYEFKLYDDNDILDFIKDEYDERTLKAYKKLTIGAAKADFFRYLILYKKGGIYLDLDSEITKNLDDLIKDREAVISREGTRSYFCQWLMIFCKGHPILKKIIDITIDNVLKNYKKLDTCLLTGPWGPYTEGINEVVNIKNLWEEDDDFINNILQNNEDNILKKTFFFKTDYDKYANFKMKNIWMMYLFKKHWKEEEGEINLDNLLIRFFLLVFIIFIIYIIYIIYKNIKYVINNF